MRVRPASASAVCCATEAARAIGIFFFQAEDGIRDSSVTGVQTCALPISYKFAEELIREPTVVFNGDILTDLDLKTVIRQHKERHAVATIVLTPVEDASAYGVVETENDGRVRRFLEKPKPDETTCKNINAATYVLEPQVLDLIPPGET